MPIATYSDWREFKKNQLTDKQLAITSGDRQAMQDAMEQARLSAIQHVGVELEDIDEETIDSVLEEMYNNPREPSDCWLGWNGIHALSCSVLSNNTLPYSKLSKMSVVWACNFLHQFLQELGKSLDK